MQYYSVCGKVYRKEYIKGALVNHYSLIAATVIHPEGFRSFRYWSVQGGIMGFCVWIHVCVSVCVTERERKREINFKRGHMVTGIQAR